MSLRTSTKDVFVIIPAYNETEVIEKVLQGLLPFHYSIVVVDDGSSVNLQKLISHLPVYIVRHKVNLGQGAALQTGIGFALSKGAAYIITFDADGQHLPEDISSLIEPLEQDKADITLGSRFIGKKGNVPARRKLLLKTARFINFFFTGLLLTDAHNGLRAMTAAAAKSIRLKQPGMAHATEIIAQIKKQKLRYTEVPVTVMYTDYSKNKGQTVWGGFRIFFDILLDKIFK